MSDALKALERLAQRKEAVIERGDGTIAFPVKALDEICPTEFAAIRAALEQGEAVAWRWECHGEHVTTDSDRARRLIADGANLQPLYAAPPSTAEAQARALEDAGESMCEHFREQRLDMTFALAVKEGLYQRAKRIREEG